MPNQLSCSDKQKDTEVIQVPARPRGSPNLHLTVCPTIFSTSVHQQVHSFPLPVLPTLIISNHENLRCACDRVLSR
ncbi:hypothetical protein FGIG_03184 [Fasciola gigantica]|uniref:Uncharacterized protein n=1 Tax=Fasciola gigantica TaxID=46835 RepID=A0A504YVW8_FASGI|nr:hypothetical protein FGIG_03184 [Fasciola gigantica]